uniref:Nebulette n=1 Tax=Sinocyclocheilus anshuiensis TaxID=1608454 RepID=A0A671QB95_9TELE
MKGLRSAITDTPEINLARENTKNVSDVQYRESVGSGTAVTDTPEMERVRRNQRNISDAKYKKAVDPVSVGVTPELERVKQNQQNISTQYTVHKSVNALLCCL